MRYAALSELRVVVGGGAALDEAAALARRAHTSLSGEFFKLQDPASLDALRDAWQVRQLPGSAVIAAHPQSIAQLDGVRGPNVATALYGALEPTSAPRLYIHTKTLARDMHTADAEAWFSTAALGGNARNEWEVAAILRGDAARSVHELADSVTSRDWQRHRDALGWARTHGIYATDPIAHDRALGDVIHELVRTEDRHLTVAMKTMFDEDFASELATRASRDRLPVDVVVERIDEPSERIMREGGVRLLRPAHDGPPIHGNVVVAEGLEQAYFGTLWASPRGFGRDHVPHLYSGGGNPLPPSQRWDRSRELGIVTDSPQGIADLRSGVELLRPHAHDFRPDVVRPG